MQNKQLKLGDKFNYEADFSLKTELNNYFTIEYRCNFRSKLQVFVEMMKLYVHCKYQLKYRI